jgi:hypothetical protein
MVGRFTCARCQLTKDLTEATATARGLTCHGCAAPPTPLPRDNGIDTASRLLTSSPVLIPLLILIAIIEFALIAAGPAAIQAFLDRLVSGEG